MGVFQKLLGNRIIRLALSAIFVSSLIMVVAPLFSDDNDIGVSTGGFLSFNASVAIAANTVVNGSGEEVDFASSDPIFSTGGLPIVSIDYSDGITVVFDGAFPDIYFGAKQLDQWAGRQTVAEAEEIITTNVQKYLEIAILLTDLIDPEDTPADNPLLQDPPLLGDNERIEKITGKDNLVVTCGYFAIHFYNNTVSFNEGDFITRISNQPITGNWWE